MAMASLAIGARCTSIQSFPLVLSSQNKYALMGKWLLGTSGFVACIVSVGGVTRLTKSGLSMVDWKPWGGLPPMNVNQWNEEFERYKKFPEWNQRKSMTIDEFKSIYWWEYGHRMLGRTVGLIFVGPGLYLLSRNKIPGGMKYKGRLLGLLGLGATQGAIGWWMVKSGLGQNRRGDRKEIRVAPQRLAVHLGMAVTTFTLLMSTSMDIFHRPNIRPMLKFTCGRSVQEIMYASWLRKSSIGLVGLTLATILSGAFVAGNDAGRAYNTFPKMSDDWIPPTKVLFEQFPFYKNFMENTALVQFNHRVLGTTTATMSITLAAISFLHPVGRNILTKQVRNGLATLGGVASIQMSLGVLTLINYVPIPLAAMHQIGSLAVLSSGVYVVHSLKYVGPRFLNAASRHQRRLMQKI